MTNKEFYFDRLLAIALENACATFHRVIHGKNCGRKNCDDCEFSTVESIENWLNAEHEELEPPLLKNGDGLKPGDWIMVRDFEENDWLKRQFVYYFKGTFFCSRKGYTPERCEIVCWYQARLPEEGE